MTTSAPAPPTSIHSPSRPGNSGSLAGDSREKSQVSADTQVSSRDDRPDNASAKFNDSRKAVRPAELQSNGENTTSADDRVSPPGSFESVLSHAIVEISPVPLTLNRNAKLPPSPSPDPKRDPSVHAIEAAIPEALKAPNRDALPLAIFFSLATVAPKSADPESKNPAAATALEAKKDDAPKLTLSSETAFSARIKLPDQEPFAIPQPKNGNSSVAINSVATEEDQKKTDSAASTAKLTSALSAAKSTLDETVPTAPAMNSQAVAPTPATIASPAVDGKAPAPVKAPNPVASVPASPPVSTTPLKEISLQLPGARGIEVKLTETAGQVRVDVRSADSALTQDLRGSLHELVSSLEKKGFSSEVNHPVEAATTRTIEMNSSKNTSSEDHGDNSGRQQQERHQQERQRQQNPSFDGRSQKSRATAWNDAIDSNLEKR